MNVKFHEWEYEEAFVECLCEQGWEYTPGPILSPRLITEALYERDLRCYLENRYSDKGLMENDYDALVSIVRNIGGVTDYLAARESHKVICHTGYDYQPLNGGEAFKVNFIDFDDEECKYNIFRCVNQYELQEGLENRRPDIVLLVNGIPVCVIELKNPANEQATISDAWSQICVRYRRDVPSLMKYAALAVISDGSNTHLGTQFTPEEYFYAWKKVENSDPNGRIGLDEMLYLVKGALAPMRLLEILRDYVYFPDVDKAQEETEIVCRYPQFFGTRMLRDNIINKILSPVNNGKGGTYFGATGCGKTHTMLFLARQLKCRYSETMGNPTVIIIVDRSDLENQGGELFCFSKGFLEDKNVRIFESRADLMRELHNNLGGGLFVTTIQKFAESSEELSDRSNIICMSDEAHRTQISLGSKMKVNDNSEDPSKLGAYFTETFAQHLHKSLPKATFIGFTGTPVAETIQVFGEVVEKYTMEQAKNDKITVPISYNARLARVFLNMEKAKEIEAYYKKCEAEGALDRDVDKSKREMASIKEILGNDERLQLMAADIVEHYENLYELNPDLIQKAMIVCCDRHIAFRLYKHILALRPEWGVKKRAYDESLYTKEELERMDECAMLNVICTRDKDKDTKEEREAFGTEAYRKKLDGLFKKDKSNFRIAVVVDMWITGFDVPCLKVLYNDKPLSKHTLIQTISRVNRRYGEKDCGLIVDYIGIRENMKEAMKAYNGDHVDVEDEKVAYEVFCKELSIVKGLLQELDFREFFNTSPIARLQFLQTATEFILSRSINTKKGKPSLKTLFLGHVKRLVAAYDICKNAITEDGTPLLNEDEIRWTQCLQGIAGYLSKITETQHNVQTMNRHVEQMVKEAINCSSVEVILEKEGGEENIYGEGFQEEVSKTKLPNTRYHQLVNLLKREIKEYGKTNLTRAEEFQVLLQAIIDEYNEREYANEVATQTISAIGDVVESKINELSDRLIDLIKGIEYDKKSFEKLGISFEEKAFYDILVKIRDERGFIYSDERCIELAKKIKTLVDGSTVYADFLNNESLKQKLDFDLQMLLYKNGYPPTWQKEAVTGVMAQVENYKSFHPTTINVAGDLHVHGNYNDYSPKQ